MIDINLNMNADTPYGLFNIAENRADEIVDIISLVCERACENYETDYRVVEVVKQEDGTTQTMQRLHSAKMLKEMLDQVDTVDEKNYVLYMAYTGINRVNEIIFAELLQGE
jgi:hypothetical protein